jgi:hypothetical protein
MVRTNKFVTITGCLIILLAASVSLAAQDKPPRPHRGFSAADDGGRPPLDPTFSFVGSEMRFGGATVKGAPYSATVITESNQTLSDGNKISRKATASVYRDGEGRTRHEQTLNSIGPFSSSGEPAQMVFIHDPVAGVQYVLDPRSHTARKMKSWSGPGPQHKAPSSTQVKTESLGTQTIEGVEAEGTRTTLTIPAGQFGNDRPIDIVSERWVSPALQVVVLSKHSDPRMGEHIFRLTNITRSEPARSLFDVPTDYTVKEDSFNHGPGGRGPRRPSSN